MFTGWHYNCRCLSQPIIDRAYLTAELEAMGFVGVDKGTKIAVPERTTKLITGQVDRYREAYPALVQANYVRFRGQERLMSELEADELLTYHFEDFVEKNSTQGFLQGTSGLDVGITEPSDPEVFMDTRLKGDRYRFNVSSLDAADGHNPARGRFVGVSGGGNGATAHPCRTISRAGHYARNGAYDGPGCKLCGVGGSIPGAAGRTGELYDGPWLGGATGIGDGDGMVRPRNLPASGS